MFKVLLSCVFLLIAASAWAAPDIDQILSSGQFTDGIATLELHLKQSPEDGVARFGLGIARFLQAIESISQKLEIYEFRQRPFDREGNESPHLPAPKELLSYARLRKIIQELSDDLAQVEMSLKLIGDADVKLPLHVGRIPLKLPGNRGLAMTLLPVLRNLRLGPPGNEADFVICFDRADVDWLRGYCHIMQGLAEFLLAYDSQGLFDVIAHRVFYHVQVPHEFLLEPSRNSNGGFFGDPETIMDLIAAIHMVRFPVKEPQRMSVSLEHFRQALVHSRQMWKLVFAETDNENEWIPGPNQQGAINIGITREMVENWLLALDEVDAILLGKKLIPFWRGKTERGINLRKVFLQPTTFDLVLWIQGTAAIPYLEEGDLSSFETWQKFDRAFGGQMIGFGVWFN